MTQPTFRDFAGAIMGGDTASAASVLTTLLGLDDAAANAATAFFQSQMSADPDFVMKSMGLRAAVTSGTDHEIATLLSDCFGLKDARVQNAVATLKRLYPR
jgi:hypothetical protein